VELFHCVTPPDANFVLVVVRLLELVALMFIAHTASPSTDKQVRIADRRGKPFRPFQLTTLAHHRVGFGLIHVDLPRWVRL
jgi:hypothetical protein